MAAVSSRELIHNFSAIAARVAAGEELTVTRHGKPLIKLAPLGSGERTAEERHVLAQKALSFRMTQPYGKAFERSDAYDS